MHSLSMTMPLDTTLVNDIMTVSSVTLRDHQSLQMANARSLASGEDCLPVVDRHGLFLGLVEFRDIVAAEKNLRIASLRRIGPLGAELGEGFDETVMPLASLIRQATETLTKQQTLRSAARAMLRQKAGVLPVLDDHQHLLGLVTISAIVQRCLSNKNVGRALACDFMTRSLVTAHPNTSVSEAMELLQNASIRHLPVLNDEGQLNGIVSQRDLLTYIRSVTTSPAPDIPLSEFIGGETWTISETTSIADAARTISDNQFGCLPVVEQDRLLGILTESDLLQACIQPKQSEFLAPSNKRHRIPVSEAMQKTILKVSSDDSIASVASLFAEHTTSLVLIVAPFEGTIGATIQGTGTIPGAQETARKQTREEQLVGVISKTDLMRELHTPRFNDNDITRELLLRKPIHEMMTSNVVTCESDLDISIAAQTLVSEHVHSLIVVKDGCRIGSFGAEEIFAVVATLALPTPISKRMTTMVFDIDCRESLRSALRFLERAGIRSLIVYDGPHPVGVFGQKEALSSIHLPLDTPIERLMSARFLCLPGTTPSYRAAQQAAALGIEQIIVWQADGAVGILSPSDFFPIVAKTSFS